jgi:cell division protein DivIC
MKRVMPKDSKIRLMFLGIICLFVIGNFFYSLFLTSNKIKNLNDKKQTLEEEIADLKDNEITLNTELEKLKNDEYKARYAREKFLYSKETGEYILDIINEEKKEEKIKEEKKDYRFIYLGISVISLIIIIMIIAKIKKK